MTTDRLERRLPEVLTELALPRVPDYVDDLLVRTARTPQRPGWTYLERWLPMSTFSAALPAGRRLSMRPLVAVLVLLALVIASIVLYAGSQRRLPPLFGLARNGAVVTADAAGNIVSVDPSNGAMHTLVTGPNLCCAGFSPDGQHIAYLHVPNPGADPAGLTVANLDGSTVRDIPSDVLTGLDWVEWTPSGDRLLLSDKYRARIFDVATGSVTNLVAPFRVSRASWIGTTGDILLTSFVSDTLTRMYRLPAGATSNPKQLAEIQYMVAPPVVSPNGSKFLYFIWGTEDRLHGDLHVFDFATGTDRALTQEAFYDNQIWENPVWSPDGSAIAAELYGADDLYRIAVISAGGGDPVVIGPGKPSGTNGAGIRFAPDGQSLLVTYRSDNTTWLLPVAGGDGRQVSWATSDDMDWQRLGQ